MSPVVWIAIFSAAAFVGSLVAVPVLLVRLPANYFSDPAARHPTVRHPVAHAVIVALKNLLGVVLVLAGIVMIFTPGQGVLTILIGVTLVDFPGKFALECRVVSQPKVFRAVNALRAKFGHEPFLPPGSAPAAAPGDQSPG